MQYFLFSQKKVLLDKNRERHNTRFHVFYIDESISTSASYIDNSKLFVFVRNTSRVQQKAGNYHTKIERHRLTYHFIPLIISSLPPPKKQILSTFKCYFYLLL